MNTASTPSVGYAYTAMANGANNSRLTGMTYPNGRVEFTLYTTPLDAAISRPDGIADGSGGGAQSGTVVEAYTYLGAGTIVARALGDGDELAYDLGGSGAGRYSGFDPFGRVVNQDWVATAATGTPVDANQLGYDADGDVLYKDDTTGVTGSTTQSEVYTNDGLNRLVGFARGTFVPASGSTPATVSSPSTSTTWSLDALGNWASTTTAAAGSPTPTTTARTNNARNQVTANGAAALSYDADGNTLNDGSGKTFAYDAWNRPAVATVTSTQYVRYQYTAGVEQAARTVAVGNPPQSLPATDNYYDAAGRVVEQDVSYAPGGSVVPLDQYVWGLGYVNDLVERDRSTDSYGRLDQRLYAMQDANYDVTSVANASGSVAERFAYDPYGTKTVLTAGYAAATDAYAFQVGFQGGIQDATTGLIRFGARDYSPVLGRWMEQDPSMYIDGSNMYAADDGSPIDSVDFTGLDGVLPQSGDPDFSIHETPNSLRGTEVKDHVEVGDGYKFDISVKPGVDFVEKPERGKPIPHSNAIEISSYSAKNPCPSCRWIQFIVREDSFKDEQEGKNFSYTVGKGKDQLIRKPSVVYLDGHPSNLANYGYFYDEWGWGNLNDQEDTIFDRVTLHSGGNVSNEVAYGVDFLVCDNHVKYSLLWKESLDSSKNPPDNYKYDIIEHGPANDYGELGRIPNDFGKGFLPYDPKADWQLGNNPNQQPITKKPL